MGIVVEDHYHSGLTKREISVEEKQSMMIDADGDVLNLLFRGDEIQEFLDAGCYPDEVWSLEGLGDKRNGISKEQMIRDAQKRFPDVPPGNFIAHTLRWFLNNQVASDTYRWSYAHLDYCGLPADERYIEMSDMAKFILPGGRLRVTFLASEDYRGLAQPFDTYDQTLKLAHEMIQPFGYLNIQAVVYKGTRSAKMLTFWADRNKNGILEP